MNEILYYIEDKYGNVIARDMAMDVAMILARALFDHYYNEDDIAFTIKRQKETETKVVTILPDEEFDKVFSYENADKAKIGMKGYFADTLRSLKIMIDSDRQPLELVEILPEECLTRFRSNEGFVYELFYPVVE